MGPVLVIGKKPVPAPVVLPVPKRSPRKVKELDKKATGQEVDWDPGMEFGEKRCIIPVAIEGAWHWVYHSSLDHGTYKTEVN